MKHNFLLVFIIVYAVAGRGQSDTTRLPEADSMSTPSSTLTVGVSVANNTNYYGQKSAEATPYAAAIASWRHSSGWYANLLGYRLLKTSGPGIASAYGMATGFDITMQKGWSTEIGYAYTYFPKNSPFLQSANPHTATLAFSHQGQIGKKLEGNYSFGHTNDFFLTFSMSKALTLSSSPDQNALVFTPLADVSGGTQRFYSYYLTGKKMRDSIAGAILDPIFGEQGRSDTATRSVTKFNVLSYNLTLPLAYQWNNCLLEFSTQLSLLSKHTRSRPKELNVFFTTSFYYQL